jgi:hypothetical protein
MRGLQRWSAAIRTHQQLIARRQSPELQQEAEELAQLAQSIPAEVEQVNHGVLPKDLNNKLKRIEKLSKHLRSDLTP